MRAGFLRCCYRVGFLSFLDMKFFLADIFLALICVLISQILSHLSLGGCVEYVMLDVLSVPDVSRQRITSPYND